MSRLWGGGGGGGEFCQKLVSQMKLKEQLITLIEQSYLKTVADTGVAMVSVATPSERMHPPRLVVQRAKIALSYG